ncbi:tyrosine-type recombinase/integrase [Nitrospinota bacterium]
MKLTKRSIDALRPPKNGTALHWDTELPGFGIRITASGVKAYVLNYRVNGRERRITIGRHGVITPTQARNEAMRLKARTRAGTDPLAEREKGRKEPTFNNLADEYEAVHLPGKKSSRDDQRYLNYLRPKLGSRKLSSITRREVQNLHRKKGETTPIQANRMASLFSKMFNLAIKWEWLVNNPAQGIERFKEKKRDRYVKEHELPRLMKAIQVEPDSYIRGFFLLLLLTGARRQEVLTMRWEDIDFELGEWRIPDTKAGRVHVVPLSPQALEILKSFPRVVGNPYVIVGRKEREHLKEPAKAWQRIRNQAGLDDVRIHDLRRTVGSYMAMGGASLPLIGKVLNHSNTSTTQIYARLGDEAPRTALESIGATIMNAYEGPTTTKVVHLGKKREQ